MSQRTDKHAPKNFDPANYRVIDYIDTKLPDMGALFMAMTSGGRDSRQAEAACAAIRAQHEERIFAHFPNYRTGGDDHTSIHQCNHCGHQGIRWVAVVEHVPTGKKLAFGEICAERCNLPGVDAFKAKYIKTRAALEAKALENKIAKAKFAADNSDVVLFLETLEKAQADYSDAMQEWNDKGCVGRAPKPAKVHPFLSDMIHALNRYGSLTENQLNATRKFAAKAAEFAARDKARDEALAAETADSPDVEAGRQDIVGTIISTKWSEDRGYGSVLKMTVKADDGNRYWGSVPESLWTTGENGSSHADKGDMVAFTATVTPSDDDKHFGFFKRPTGAMILTKATEAA